MNDHCPASRSCTSMRAKGTALSATHQESWSFSWVTNPLATSPVSGAELVGHMLHATCILQRAWAMLFSKEDGVRLCVSHLPVGLQSLKSQSHTHAECCSQFAGALSKAATVQTPAVYLDNVRQPSHAAIALLQLAVKPCCIWCESRRTTEQRSAARDSILRASTHACSSQHDPLVPAPFISTFCCSRLRARDMANVARMGSVSTSRSGPSVPRSAPIGIAAAPKVQALDSSAQQQAFGGEHA